MKAVEAMREIMRSKGVSIAALAGRVSAKPNTITQRLSQPNISIDKLNEMLRVLDYKVVVVPREARIPDGGYEVE